jgi:hypothetical protein
MATKSAPRLSRPGSQIYYARGHSIESFRHILLQAAASLNANHKTTKTKTTLTMTTSYTYIGCTIQRAYNDTTYVNCTTPLYNHTPPQKNGNSHFTPQESKGCPHQSRAHAPIGNQTTGSNPTIQKPTLTS